jgi:hypothetical protein
MVAGDEHCQLRAAIEVLVPYNSPPSWLADWLLVLLAGWPARRVLVG